MAKTLNSPGIEVIEKDESARITTNTGNTVFVPGFAAQGPVEEVNVISSIADFESIYGVPTNAAERYFYYTVKAILNAASGTTVLVSRLPYGSGEGDTVSNAFNLLAYPAIPIIKGTNKYDFYKADVDETELKNVIRIQSGDPSLIFLNNNPVISDLKGEILLTNDVLKKYAASGAKIAICTKSTESQKHIELKDTLFNKKTPFEIELGYRAYTVDDEGTEHDIPGTSATIRGNLSVELASLNSDTYKFSIAATIPETDKVKAGQLVISFIASGQDVKPSDGAIKYLVIDNGGITFSLEKSDYRFKGENGKSVNFDGTYVNKDGALSDQTSDVTYLIGAPVSYNISLNQYYRLLTGEIFEKITEDGDILMGWSNESNFDFEGDTNKIDQGVYKFENLRNAAFIAINTSRTVVNDNYEGMYFGITDNIFNTPDDNWKYSAARSIKISTGAPGLTGTDQNSEAPMVMGYEGEDDKEAASHKFLTLHKSRLDFTMEGNTKGTISEYLQHEINTFDTSENLYDDTINLSIFKLRKTATANQILKLNYGVVESYNASIGINREYTTSASTTPISYYIENIIDGSNNLQLLVNPNIAKNIKIDENGELHGKIRIYSDKLISGIAYSEDNNLKIDCYKTTNNKTCNLNTPIILTQRSIDTYKQIVDQLGFTPSVLDDLGINFKEDDLEYNAATQKIWLSNSLYPFGVYAVDKTNLKIIGNVPGKLRRALTLIKNDEEYEDINLLVDGGLSTIYVYTATNDISGESNLLATNETGTAEIGAEDTTARYFNENTIIDGIENLRVGSAIVDDKAQQVIDSFMEVQNEFLSVANSFTNGGRGDTFYIGDTLRGILIKGRDTKVEKLYGSTLINDQYDASANVNHSWSTSIYWPHKNLFNSFVSSYASVYAQWFKVSDIHSGERVWVPASGYVAAKMINADAADGPWLAAAGLNRGVITGVADCAISPTQIQRGDLYKICINSIPKMANTGIVIWGIRTMSKKASAFDQNTCRRTFLYIESAIKKLLRWYVFEPNNTYTRLAVYNEIEPFMSTIQTRGGIYNYTVVCDTSNNTADVINNGELAVDVSAAPTRTAENIVLTMVANKYTSGVSTTEFNS